MDLGKILVFSAPSGAGKTTIVKHLVKKFTTLSFSISATTRPMREGETHGKDYYFLSLDEFKEKLKAEAFVESQEVYSGVFYGTLKSEIERIRKEGRHVVLDVDVQGGINLKNYYKNNALAVFVKPPNITALETRLRVRNTETEDTLKERVKKAAYELTFSEQFDQILLNDSLEEAFERAENIVELFLDEETQVQ